MKGQRALVTGAAGFIGSHLVEMLVRQGTHVRAFVRYNSGQRAGNLELLPDEVRAHVERYDGDLPDPGAVARCDEGRRHRGRRSDGGHEGLSDVGFSGW